MAIWKKSILSSALFILGVFAFEAKGHADTFEKLSSAYTVSYGDPQAPVHVIEYFSFSCPQCLALLKKEFPLVKEKYINPGKVYWTFHPDPADLLTLQGMICFEKLSDVHKNFFLEEVAKNLRPHSLSSGRYLFQELMKGLGKPIPELSDLRAIEKTEAFQEAYVYLSQKQVPSDLPTIEINGRVYAEFPSLKVIDQILISLQPSTDRRLK